MSKQTFTRRELARQAVAGAAGAFLISAPVLISAKAAAAPAPVVDPLPDAPPPLTIPPDAKPLAEGQLLTQLVPVNAGYTLTDTQAAEVEKQLKDYPGAFAKARVYLLPDDLGPAFAADAPQRKERIQ